MANTGCVIYRGIDRPPQKLIDAFRGIPVANIDDCMNRIAAISSEIKPVGPSGLCGPALTVKVAEGDNLMLHKALDLARPGMSSWWMPADACTAASWGGSWPAMPCSAVWAASL